MRPVAPHPDKRGLYRPNAARAAPSIVPGLMPAALKPVAALAR